LFPPRLLGGVKECRLSQQFLLRSLGENLKLEATLSSERRYVFASRKLEEREKNSAATLPACRSPPFLYMHVLMCIVF
jgi:hypothetical protein